VFFILFLSCQSNKKSENKYLNEASDIHKVVAQEIIQVGNYTYLRALEENVEKWIAAPSFKGETGEIYYFKNGMEMSNFESKELNRFFKIIYFVEKISASPSDIEVKEPIATDNVNFNSIDLSQQATKPIIEKEEIKIELGEGVVSIAELYKNKSSYDTKIIEVRGKITKFNPAIMNKNWIHIQDGTEHNNEFDLTLVSNSVVKVGDIYTFKGKLALNKDFGAGYTYKLILEDVVIIK
tara:strand:+ start:6394 stop:7107 length:714 start_codon:yes stop_codon:yes gene_type:complete